MSLGLVGGYKEMWEWSMLEMGIVVVFGVFFEFLFVVV